MPCKSGNRNLPQLFEEMPVVPEKHVRPRKVLFFAEAVTLAHMARPAVLAGMLDPAEFEVVVARDARYVSLFPDLSVRQIDLYSVSTQEFVSALAKGSPLYGKEVLEHYIEDDLRVIDQEKPDIVVGDFRLSLSVSARLRNIPYVAIANAYWSPYAQLSYTIPEHPLNRILGVGQAEALFRAVRPIIFALHSVPLNRVRKRHGLKTLGLNLNRVYTDSDYVLYADIPSLVDMKDLPANHRYLGAVLWSPAHEYPAWWPDVDDSACNIYLTLGSSGRADLVPAIVDALADMPVKLLVSTAGQRALPLDSPNLFSAEYLPGEAAAGKSKLVICNGGSLTTYQAFSQSVPVLGIAGNLDQHLNMSAIEKRGAGIRLRTDQLRAACVRAAVLSLIEDDTYSTQAERLGEEMAEINVKENFSEFLRSI